MYVFAIFRIDIIKKCHKIILNRYYKTNAYIICKIKKINRNTRAKIRSKCSSNCSNLIQEFFTFID